MGKKRRKQTPPDHPAVQRMSSNMVLAERSLFASGQVMTQFVLMAPPRVFSVATPWEDPHGKQIYYQLLYLFCCAENVSAVTLIAEAWSRHVQRQAGETESALLERVSELPPSKAEDKFEVILVGTCYRDDGTIKMTVDAREIVRDDTGAPARTEPFPFKGGLPLDATISHLLPPPGLTDEARLAARRELTLAQIRCGVVLNPILLPTAH
jgi:hypothetical protein